MSIKNRHRLKKKEIMDILNKLSSRYSSTFFTVDSSVEIGSLDRYRVILVDNEIDFMIIDNEIVFTLQGLYKYNPGEFYVVVDMGAIGFIIKGADIMVPGITDADINIQKGDYVWISDEQHRKPLAVGKALMTGEEMKSKNAGKAIKNIHYVGDSLWNFSSNVI